MPATGDGGDGQVVLVPESDDCLLHGHILHLAEGNQVRRGSAYEALGLDLQADPRVDTQS